MKRGSGALLRPLLLAFCCAGAPLRAGEDAVGTTSANFMKIPYSARPAGMGEAFTAVSDDESAFEYNPAGAAQMLQGQLAATSVEWFQGINLEHLGAITPVSGLGSVGLGVTWLGAGTLVATQRVANSSDALDNYIETGTFTPYDLAVNMAWAWQPAQHWDVGLGGQLIQEAIDTSSGWGLGLDLGVQRTDLWGWLDAGAVVQNLGTPIAVGTAASGEPITFKAGLAGRFFNRNLTIATDLAVPEDNNVIPSVGAEWWVAQPLALRVGWMGGYASQPTAGLGLRYQIFLLDYAYQPFSQLGDTSRVTLSVEFGGPSLSVLATRPLLGPVGDPQWRQGDFVLKPDKPDSVVTWSLSLLDNDGTVDRVWAGDGPPPARVSWDGRDSQDKVLPDGLYKAHLEVVYPGGLKAQADSGKVELDSTPPTMNLAEDPLVVRPNAQGELLIPAHLRMNAHDKNGVGAWRLELTDKTGKPFRIFGGEGEPPADIVWDGSDAQGGFVSSGSTYYFWPFAKDRLGNWGRGAPRALTVLMKEIRFDIASDALFEPGKADVRISAYHQLIDLKAMILRNHQEGTKVDIIGNTDNTPVVYSVYHDNQTLSLARAQAVAKFLVTLLGMDPAMLNPVGMGDKNPKASNDTPDGREANRRVEVVIHARLYQQ
jgi:outer membrane protein OmpA-like peptidoglycan-associated protein